MRGLRQRAAETASARRVVPCARSPPALPSLRVRAVPRHRGQAAAFPSQNQPERAGGLMTHVTRGIAAIAAVGMLALGGIARAQLPLNTDITNLSGFGAPLLAIIGEVGQGNDTNFELFADGQ